MSRRSICALLTVGVLCCALANSNEFVATSELVKKQQPPEDKLLASIVRARNSSRAPYPKENDGAVTEEYDKGFDKRPRTENRDNCCGSRYGSTSSTRRPDSYYNRIAGDSGRYPTKFGERLPADRYGWQTQGQPAGFNGSAGRPAGGTYAAPVLYEGSQAGDRFGSRPSYGGESSRKPPGYGSGLSGGYGYGYGNGNGNGNDGYGGYGFGRPPGYGGSTGGGGYGISGTLANGDEFGPAEPSYPDGNAPTHPNIQAQKAVALKALAGVALIGAAAALATNPVLLPLGVVSGRRKRSNLSVRDKDAYMDYILAVLKRDATKNYSDEDGNKMTLSPACIARLACEIQKNYWLHSRRNPYLSKRKPELERRLDDLVLSNVPREDAASTRVKKLLKAATFVASTGGNCNTFTCTFVKTKEAKNPSILKL